MTEINITKKSNCSSLTNKATPSLSYEVGTDTKKTIYIRISNNTGGGYYNGHWQEVQLLLHIINEEEEPFSASVLSPLFKGQSNNSAGFLLAILLNEEFVTTAEGGYQRTGKDIKTLNRKPRRKAA